MSLSRLNLSPIGLTDSYKGTHHLQYPMNITNLYSYFESRGGEFEETVFFGLYYILTEYLSTPITQTDVDYFESRFEAHFGSNDLYNAGDWQKILDECGGLLPIRIRAVPEGMVVPTSNVLMTVENTDDRFPWLTNYVETILCHLWYASTVATLSREAKKVITKYARYTGSPIEGVAFKLHDFGFRGASSVETAAIGGAAHLINFLGTDTMVALEFVKQYYEMEMAGFSIPAAEHSTIMTHPTEIDAFRQMIAQFGEGAPGMYAVVSDTNDIMHAVRNIWGGELLEEVRGHSNMLIVRPDSGDVVTVVMDVLQGLDDTFGSTINGKGFKVLDGVRVIQGDGMSLRMISEVCSVMYLNRWAIENIAFGMGGGLLQNVNRDTSRYAFKASAVTRDDVEFSISKNPVTDAGKRSKEGRLVLVHDLTTGEFTTKHPSAMIGDEVDILETVYENGVYLLDPPKFEDIRNRAALTEPEYV